MKYTFICLLFLLSCQTDQKNKLNLYQFIPQDTQVVIQINEGIVFKETWNANSSIRSLSPSNKEVKILTSLIKENSKNSSILCFSATGKEKFSTILIQKKEIDTLKSIPNLTNYSGVKIKETSIEGINLYTILIDQNEIISVSKLMIENIIRNYQKNQSGIFDKDFYQLLKNIERNSVFNILIKKKSNSFLNNFLPQSFLFPNFNENWIAFDGDFNSPMISLDGITLIKDSIPSKLSVFKNLDPKKIKSTNIIPQSFNSFISLPIDNIPQLADKIKTYANYYNTPLNSNSLKDFSSVDEITIMEHSEGNAVIIHNSNLNQSIIDPSVLLNSYRNIKYGKIDNNPKALNTILDLFKIEFKANFSALINDYYVLSNKESLIKTIITSVKDSKTLDKSENFISLTENLSDLNSGLWVSKTKLFNTSKTFSGFDSKEYPLVAMQWVNDDEISHLHIRFGNNVPKNKKNTVINQLSLNSEFNIISKPKWIKNHRSKEYDIIFQDKKNTLYLYSNTGNLFWKKQLSEKIIGEIKQVDLYKNKKLQIAFRTKNHFMILDRNGEIVKPFDKIIKSKSQPLPLSVFDYDNNRDYRFLLAQDKNLVMFNSKGNEVSGFKFSKTNSPVLYEPKHLRIKGKDFITIQEENGKLNILNRKGDKAINIESDLLFSQNPIWLYLNTFTTSDVDGNIVQIDTKGNVIKSSEGWAKDHLLEMSSKTLVSISENILTIKGIPIKLPYGNYTRPKIFYIKNTLYISTTDIDSQKVYLYLSNGASVDGFPVYGTGPADITNADNDEQLEMIVQSEPDGIIIYQIN